MRTRLTPVCMKPLLTVAAASFLTACSTGPEEAILSSFFAAARLRDSTALASIAAVGFEPNEQGVITSFTIASVSPGRRRPLTDRRIAELSVESPHPADPGTYNGEMETKDVTIAAPVRRPNGQISDRRLVVTVERAILTGETEIVGHWVISQIKEVGQSASW
jgi:hypothetical protein